MTRANITCMTALLAALALPVVATPALAAQPPATAAAADAGAAPALPKAMAANLDQHIAGLHEQLAITPAEQAQWDQFAQVMRDNAVAMHQAIEARGGKLAKANAAENMASYAALARVHADNMEKLSSSFQTLYSGLSDDQKQVADTVFRNEHGKHQSLHKQAG